MLGARVGMGQDLKASASVWGITLLRSSMMGQELPGELYEFPRLKEISSSLKASIQVHGPLRT